MTVHPHNHAPGITTAKAALFILIWIASAMTSAAPPSPVEIIRLHARPAAEVIPLIRPFVGKDGTLSGMRDQLIIRTSPQNMAEIRRILKEIDRPPRRLMIYVHQGQEGDTTRQHIQGGIDARTGRTRIRLGDGGNQVHGIYGRTRSDRDVQQRVQALEGRPAFIATGTSYPVPRSATVVRDGVIYATPAVGYRTTATGFYVRAQLVGERVTLFISPRLERPGPHGGSFEYQTATTTVSGRLGQWITIGGVGEQASTTQSERLRRITTRGGNTGEIKVKVVALD